MYLGMYIIINIRRLYANMKEEAFLCYVNAKDYFFDNINFNFDHKYFFDIEVDKSETYFKYILCVSKRKSIVQTKGFWGNNISTVNAITGSNGSGKTSILKFIINNIGRGTTAMNGEGVVYIVNKEETYIVCHNCRNLTIKKDKDIDKMDILQEKEYDERLRNSQKYIPPFDNRRFWKHIVFFSNYFGSLGYLKDDGYVINASKDKEINKMINNMEELTKLPVITIQSAFQNYRNMKILGYIKEGLFTVDNLKEIISLPDLLRFKLTYTRENYGEFYVKEQHRFPNGKWIGKKRYPVFCIGQILSKSREFEFEAAINKFSVDLMWFLLQEKSINESLFCTFIDILAETEEQTGIEIAIAMLKRIPKIEKWMDVLNYMENDSQKYIIAWQNSDEFFYKWSIEDVEFVERLISSNETNRFFSCDLIGSERNGYYSSGEESRMNFLLSLFDVLKSVDKKKSDCNQNIILVLDEVDAYFHPKYQINLVDDLVRIVSEVLKDYYVQIIFTCNTPLELSDLPASNICYLENGKLLRENNEMPPFEYPDWYLQEVRKFLVDGRLKDSRKISDSYKKNIQELNNLLGEIVTDEDFSNRVEGYTLFEKIVLAPYEELKKIHERIKGREKELFLETTEDNTEEKKERLKEKWKPIYNLYDKLISRGLNTKLVQKYGIKCCPYCNENYIFNRKKKNNKKYSMAQLDHFYPRDIFPIFSVSLYNLVPVCGPCNHIKSTTEIGISPHDHSFDFSQMKITYIPKSVDWIERAEDIDIKFQYDEDNLEFEKRMRCNLDIMGIEYSYHMHADYVQEIIKKAQVYGKEIRSNLLNDFPDLFKSDEELIRAIFSNYIDSGDLLNRPLSKLTQDLLKELGIIL